MCKILLRHSSHCSHSTCVTEVNYNVQNPSNGHIDIYTVYTAVRIPQKFSSSHHACFHQYQRKTLCCLLQETTFPPLHLQEETIIFHKSLLSSIPLLIFATCFTFSQWFYVEHVNCLLPPENKVENINCMWAYAYPSIASKNTSSSGSIWAPTNTWFPGSTRVPIQNST